MYYPDHQAQLTGRPTESVDCGVIGTSVAVDGATKGAKVPGVQGLRRRMGLKPKKPSPTNPYLWERAIESFDTAPELAGKYERLTGTRLSGGSWSQLDDHIEAGKLAIAAVDYGTLRRAAPRKTGSESFDDLHAIVLGGEKDRQNGGVSWRDADSLNDGRYKSRPKGWVWMEKYKAKDAALDVGKQLGQGAKVHAYLIGPATRIGGFDPGPVDPPVEPSAVTLGSLLADLLELRHIVNDAAEVGRLDMIIADYEQLLGIPDLPEQFTPVSGVAID